MYLRRLLILMAWMCIFLTKNNAQVNADFSANITEGCGTLAVSFTDLSTSNNGTITSWDWDLGGVTVNTQAAGRIFQEGFYEICLTVTDSNGDTDTECRTDFIKVYQIPVPDFTADNTSGCAPLNVVFEDLSSSPDGAITQWIWGVGGDQGVIVDDGTMPSIQNQYTISDGYDISLTITNENGCVGSITKEDFITISPAANIQISADDQFQCSPPFNVNFTNQNIEPNIEYTWDFGNGATYVGENPPSVTYLDPGSYDVTVVGVDITTGCTETRVYEEYIRVGYPIEFTFDQTEICAGAPVSFEDISGSTANGVLWEFGDGGVSDDPNPTYTFETPGCYTVSLTRYSNGCANTEESDICIQVNELPSALYTVVNNEGCSVPHTSSFAGSAQNATMWFWEFGEGGVAGTSSEANPSVTFTEFGIYPIYLTVSDAGGCANTMVIDTVKVVETNAAMLSGQIDGCAPLTFGLSDASTTIAPIMDWSWEIETPGGVLTSTEATPTFTIPDTGCYDITLAVINELGCVDTSIINRKVCVGMEADIDFEANPTPACVNENVVFNNLSSPFATDWFWSFGDSIYSISENPEHEYIDTGSFDVMLTVIHHGCENDLIKENFISTLAPKANFIINNNCNDLYNLQLINTSIDAETIAWDFGDLTTTSDVSTLDTVSYTYPDTGNYVISLTTYNSVTGCADTSEFIYYITDPKADFSVDTTQGCMPLTVTVENNSLFADTYFWTSGSATFSDHLSPTPEITFNTPGTFDDIFLTITDVNGCENTIGYNGEIQVNQITSDFNFDPPFGCNPLDVDFTDNSTSFYGNITSWEWYIGNGYETSNLQNPSFTLDSIGNYTVSLTVTDDWNCQNTLDIPDAISVTQPFAKFKGDTLGCTISTMKFLNQSHGSGLTYEWTFGDGGISTEKNPTYTYVTEGVFTVCLTITDINGCTDTYCLDDYVNIANPIAAFTSDTSAASCPPLIVNFENLSQNASSYEWNFGDNSGNANIENPPHVYSVPGVFDVTLIAIASDVCRDTITLTDFISLDGPDGSFTIELDDPCIPSEVNFYAESNDFYTYIWDYGNGVLDTSGYKMTDTVSYLYTQSNDYIPNLILIDDQGCIRPIPAPDTIKLVGLEADFEADQTKLCNNNPPVIFTNTSITSEPIVSIEWLFEGGNPATSTDLNPAIQYSNPGVFDVTLIVDNGTCLDTITKTDFISVGEVPVADFSMSQNAGCAPLPVDFTDESTINTGYIDKWDWTFSPTSPAPTSTLQNPSYTYIAGEDGAVQLRVTSNEGCMDSITKLIDIFPVVDLGVSEDTTICQGEIITITGAILSDTTGINFYWENDPTLSCTDCLSPMVNPLDTTTYTFVAVNADNCMYSTSVTINVRDEAVPVVTISNDTTICANDVTQIFASGGDNLVGYDWDQSASGLTCYNACNNPIASPIANTTYTVTVTNSSGCSSTASTTVNVFYEFQELLGEDRTICEGDTAHLQILTGNNPFWIESDGLSCAACPDPVASPEETSTFIVRVDSDFGCEILDTITVNILTDEDIDAGDDIAVCGGTPAQLTGFGEGIPSWSPAATLNQTDIFNPLASPTENTMYYFSLENGDCILTDSVKVEIIEKTEIELIDQSVCNGEGIILQPIGIADTFQWMPNESLSSFDIENPTASPTETTEYTVIAQSGTCPPDTASAFVEVLENPTLNVAGQYQYFPGDPIVLDVTSLKSGNFAYQWTPGIGLSCTDCPAPTATLDADMVYTVIITDLETGCSFSEHVNVSKINECSEELISMPNAFSPNEDGQNDTYQMYSGTIEEIEYFRVFDRWGALVYESNDRNFVWDGKFNNKVVAEGVYIYMLSGKCKLDGSTIMKMGDITIHK